VLPAHSNYTCSNLKKDLDTTAGGGMNIGIREKRQRF
jgi:hypothetical protein